MAKIIIINREQIKKSLARFELLLAKDESERERLLQIQQEATGRSKGARSSAASPSSKREEKGS
jgi:hypothetical protein